MAQMLTMYTRKEGKGDRSYWPQMGTFFYSGDDELPEDFKISGYLHSNPGVPVFISVVDKDRKKRKTENEPDW